MAIFTGLNLGFYLGDVNNLKDSLSNLGLEYDDLDKIRGLSNIITRRQLHLLSNLTRDYEKAHYSNRVSAEFISGYLTEIPDASEGLMSNLRLDHQLRASMIKYNYLTYNATANEDQIKSADISTSRISSWSQVVNPGPVFYGADVKINPSNAAGTSYGDNDKSVVKADTITLLGGVTPRRFDAEVATHEVEVKVNGVTRKLFAMRNIPLSFDGNFGSASFKYKINPKSPVIKPAVVFVDTDQRDPIDEGIAYFGSGSTSTLQTATHNSKASSKRTDFYYPPNEILQLEIAPTGLSKFPNAVLNKIRVINFPSNIVPEMPDFFAMNGGNEGNTLTLTNVNASGNQFKSTPSRPKPTAARQVLRLPYTIESLGINACFQDSSQMDVSKLKDSVVVRFNTPYVSGGNLITNQDIDGNAIPHGFVDNELVLFEGSSFSNLTDGEKYYVRLNDANSFRISDQSGGSALALTPANNEFNFVTKLRDSNIKTFNHSVYQGNLGNRMTATGPSPIVNPDKIETYNIYDQNYSSLHSSVQTSRTIKSVNINSSGVGGTITLPNENINGVVGEHPIQRWNASASPSKIVNMSGKKYLKEYYHTDTGGANPSGGIEGFFSGCLSLETLSLEDTNVTGRINVVVAGLPSLKTANFKSTRFSGRMSPDTFAGTTAITSFQYTGGDANFTDGGGTTLQLDAENNFFDNDFEVEENEIDESNLNVGDAFYGGYYAGRMVDTQVVPNKEYFLIVADKSQEQLLPRYSVMNDHTGTRTVNTITGNGWVNTETEITGGSNYSAAKFADDLNTGGFNDWYLPARDELEQMYRLLKPSSENNDTGHPVPNSNSSPTFNASYSTTNPSRTSAVAFRSGNAQAFDDSSSTQHLTGGTWTPIDVPAGNVTDTGATVSVTQDSDGAAGVSKTVTLQPGVYDFSVAVSTNQLVVSSGSFVPGQDYKITNVGASPSTLSNVAYSAVNFANNYITKGSHGYLTGQAVDFSYDSGGNTLINNLVDGDTYYIIRETAGRIKLASSYADAVALNALDLEPESLATTYVVSGAAAGSGYTFTGEAGNNPTLSVVDGEVVTIDNTAHHANHPIQVQDSSGNIVGQGASFSFTASSANAPYTYVCEIHSSMSGSISVAARSVTFDITYNRNATWNEVGVVGTATSGTVFTAATDGSIIPSGGATLSLSENQEEVLVKVNDGDADAISQTVTAENDTVTGTIYLHTAGDVVVSAQSANLNFTLSSISLINRSAYYWSSTSDNVVNGYAQNFKNGEQKIDLLNHPYLVRPVRRLYRTIAGAATEIQGTSSTLTGMRSLVTFVLKGKGNTVGKTNNIRGKMPNITGLTSLKTVEIQNTELGGLIPTFPASGNLSSMTLAKNRFTGDLSITGPSLSTVDVSNNQLTSFSTCTSGNLKKLTVSNNLFGGTLPDFSACTKLQSVYINDCTFTEYLSGLASATSLVILQLKNNNLSAGAAERLLRDLLANYEAKNRGGVQINLRGNAKISQADLLNNPALRDIINTLRKNAKWKIELNP